MHDGLGITHDARTVIHDTQLLDYFFLRLSFRIVLFSLEYSSCFPPLDYPNESSSFCLIIRIVCFPLCHWSRLLFAKLLIFRIVFFPLKLFNSSSRHSEYSNRLSSAR